MHDSAILSANFSGGNQTASGRRISESSSPDVLYSTIDQDADIFDLFSKQLGTEWAYWWVCQCTPVPKKPPIAPSDQAMTMLATLDTIFNDPGLWSSSDVRWRKTLFNASELFTNVPIKENTRECLLVAVQRFLRTAIESHGFSNESPLPSLRDSHNGLWSGSMRLPPTEPLQIYLELFLGKFEPHYPLLPARSLDPNRFVSRESSKGLMLLFLSMLAYGSMLDPAPKAQRFSTAITEICRLSITDISYKDASATRSALFLCCALLFTIKGAFSGTKIHMSTGITHRHVYLTASAPKLPA